MDHERQGSLKSSTGVSSRPEGHENAPSTREVLQEFFQLLEDYAPTWYTEEHHDRAVAALRAAGVDEAGISEESGRDD